MGQSDYLLVLRQLCILSSLPFHVSIPGQLKSYRANSTFSNFLPHIRCVYCFPNTHCIYLRHCSRQHLFNDKLARECLFPFLAELQCALNAFFSFTPLSHSLIVSVSVFISDYVAIFFFFPSHSVLWHKTNFLTSM